MTAQEAVTGESFLEAVHRHITPAMRNHGYGVCGEGEGRTTTGTRVLASRSGRVNGGWLRRLVPNRGRWERVVSVGYENEDGDERWVEYYPERSELDLSQIVPQGDGTSTASDQGELERRLKAGADHVRDFGPGS